MDVSKNHILVIILVICAVFGLYYASYQLRLNTEHDSPICNAMGTSSSLVSQLEKQRNDASLMLNRLQEKFQQLVCRNKQQEGTSETGGWCEAGVRTGHATDFQLAKGLASLFLNKTVVGLGDGRGEYRRRLLDYGLVYRYDAFDGAPNITETTGGQVGFIDLSMPQYWLPTYDWVLCLEVIEHIPAEYEAVVLDNVARAAGVGAVISWASGEAGFHHVNCRPLEYVRKVMKRLGFHEDIVWSRRLRSAAALSWLKTNVLVFRRRLDVHIFNAQPVNHKLLTK